MRRIGRIVGRAAWVVAGLGVWGCGDPGTGRGPDATPPTEEANFDSQLSTLDDNSPPGDAQEPTSSTVSVAAPSSNTQVSGGASSCIQSCSRVTDAECASACAEACARVVGEPCESQYFAYIGCLTLVPDLICEAGETEERVEGVCDAQWSMLETCIVSEFEVDVEPTQPEPDRDPVPVETSE